MLAYILFGLFILSCLVLVVVVLLQPGKADAGALFTSSVSSTAFGPRGTQNILAKITIGAAISFMLIGLLLSLPGINGSNSVLQSEAVPVASPTATPSPSPEASPTATATPAAATASPAGATDVKKPTPAAAASPAAKTSPK